MQCNAEEMTAAGLPIHDVAAVLAKRWGDDFDIYVATDAAKVLADYEQNGPENGWTCPVWGDMYGRFVVAHTFNADCLAKVTVA